MVVTEGAREQAQGGGGISPRVAAWLAWSLMVLSVVLLVGGLALDQMTRSTAQERPYYGPVDAVFYLATVLTFSVVGAIIASRQPRNAIGWLFCGVGLVMGLNSLTGGYAEYRLSGGYGPWSFVETAAWFASWSWTILVYLPTSFLLLLFPDGRLPSPRWRPVAWCAALGLIGFVAGTALQPGPLGDFPQIVNPYGVDSLILEAVAVTGAILALASMVASAGSLIVRMRRAGTVERQQIKWLAYGGAVVVGTIFASGFVSIWSVPLSILIISAALLGLPVFTCIAILRYRLYDIDIIINRTLVYGSLTLLLALVYFGGVTATQAIFRTLSGQEQQPQLAIVVSTLAIAALFSPLRHRIQSFIDRRFYRRKYDARKTLEAFSAKLRDETDLDRLGDELMGVVHETIQPAHVSLWLHPDATLKDKKKRAPIRESGRNEE